MKTILLSFSVFFLALPLAAQSNDVTLKNAKGDSVGTARLSADSSGGVKIDLDLHGLPSGEHAIHIHSVPKCEAPAFTSAGPHFNPEKKHHGLQNPDGPHAGAKTSVTAAHANLSSGQDSVLANGGTALVIHAGPDDMKSDPAGKAGDRIACGVITQ